MSLTVITGPPGAGKTTVASILASQRARGVHIVAGQFFRWIVAGYIPPWSASSTAQNVAVMTAIGAAGSSYARAGYDVLIDGIVGPWFLPYVQRAAQLQLSELQYVVLRPNIETALHRATQRGGSDLTDEGPIRRMYRTFEQLGRFEAAVIDSSDLDLVATAEVVQRGLASSVFDLSEEFRPDMDRLAAIYGITADDR